MTPSSPYLDPGISHSPPQNLLSLRISIGSAMLTWIYGIKAYFDRIIKVCDRVPISKQYISSVISPGPYICYWISREFCRSIAPLRYQIRTICKVRRLSKSDKQFWFLHQFHAKSLKSLWDHPVEHVLKNILMTCSAGRATSWAVSWAANFQSGVVEGRKSFCLKCIKNIQYNLFPYLVGIKIYNCKNWGISQYFDTDIINLREATNQRAASNHVTPMWQSNMSDFPQGVFKNSSLQNLLKLLTKRSLIYWQIYMESIYWQVIPTV